jgi:hypothetical protein
VASHHVIGVAASGDESDEPARSDQDELERQPAAGRRRGLLGAFGIHVFRFRLRFVFRSHHRSACVRRAAGSRERRTKTASALGAIGCGTVARKARQEWLTDTCVRRSTRNYLPGIRRGAGRFCPLHHARSRCYAEAPLRGR